MGVKVLVSFGQRTNGSYAMDPGAAAFSEVDWFDGQKLTGFTRDHLIGRGSTGAVFLLRNSIDELVSAPLSERRAALVHPVARQGAARHLDRRVAARRAHATRDVRSACTHSPSLCCPSFACPTARRYRGARAPRPRVTHNSQAVVKELDVGRMSPKERQQAAQEVRLLSELSHPNIIAYYGTVFHKRRQVLEIYMEYAECGTLADVILERQCRHDAKGIEEQTVMRWTRQMISALRCVHKRKIIHRDLKPSNVFVTKDGACTPTGCGRARSSRSAPLRSCRVRARVRALLPRG